MTTLDLHGRHRLVGDPPNTRRGAFRRAVETARRRGDLVAQEPVRMERPAPRAHAASDVPGHGCWEPTPEQRLRHDLRQSVGLLMALTEAVQQNVGQATELLGHLGQLRHETERMADLVAAQAGSGGEPQRVDVGQVVADLWRSAVAAAPCRMRLVCDAATPAVVDAVALARSVRNLLDNAVRAAGCDGTVVVAVRDDGDAVTVTVSDTGPGFGNVPTQHGLGLVTVRRFAADCGGTLEVAESPGDGAELVLRVPSAVLTGEELTCAS